MWNGLSFSKTPVEAKRTSNVISSSGVRGDFFAFSQEAVHPGRYLGRSMYPRDLRNSYLPHHGNSSSRSSPSPMGSNILPGASAREPVGPFEAGLWLVRCSGSDWSAASELTRVVAPWGTSGMIGKRGRGIDAGSSWSPLAGG